MKGFLFIFRKLLHVKGIICIRRDERKGSQKLEFARQPKFSQLVVIVTTLVL